ncbi:MAG: bifunctional phosphoribosylaminoimidazolecarboxamide formyltransferase/IMP cyclohydrolase [Hyphomicrobiaceae bacterium]
MTDPTIRRALISVSDKTGIGELARELARRGITLVSTGGTRRHLQDQGLAVVDIAEVTGFPEMMDGRLKTLHPKVHGGLLAVRDHPEHVAAMTAHDIAPIDLLIVNLYPFEATVAAGQPEAECIENIDIGGPAMLRAAAKNHASVTVVTDPADYQELLTELDANIGATTLAFRRRLAAKTYATTARYDAMIATWMFERQGATMPPIAAVAGTRAMTMRYGENPHQQAALYRTPGAGPSLAAARQVQGKELSYNNIADADAAFELVSDLDRDRPALAIIKHANPCGVATGATLIEAYRRALKTDPVSAFGGIVAVNRALDAETATEISRVFTEVIVAPEADDGALKVLAGKPNVRLLLTGGLLDPKAVRSIVKTVSGGFLLQSRDAGLVGAADLKVVTKRSPMDRELADLLFAFRVAKHVKSNAIVYVKNGATVGIGAGQMSRVDSARIAASKASAAALAAGETEPLTKGSVVASDAFFPFADGLITAAEAGVTAVIQPGGSVRDDEVIAAADERGLAMVFTGVRHFRH